MRMDASFIPQSNHGTMVEKEDLGSMSSSSENSSASSDFMEDATSSASSSSLLNKDDHFEGGPLYRMSSLAAQLPFNYRRGLSKFYNGKSQSFTSLSNVRGLEDLAKPERPCRKKLKSSRSCGGDLDWQKSLSLKGCSKIITKKASRGSSFSLGARSRPPIPPQKSSNFSSNNLLFASRCFE
ncbi:uncharacterized protein LOC103723717 [Phoenix dactylifera]|uniref:Uncharacterized protein LOC103723717 n=1 Tax=Phoenix dactylifera TaxID=42345 RepID=A0A8B7D4E2_PHODC|nr:uncharacterized protein LOC103723717 [Phoenix dactylifera]